DNPFLDWPLARENDDVLERPGLIVFSEVGWSSGSPDPARYFPPLALVDDVVLEDKALDSGRQRMARQRLLAELPDELELFELLAICIRDLVAIHIYVEATLVLRLLMEDIEPTSEALAQRCRRKISTLPLEVVQHDERPLSGVLLGNGDRIGVVRLGGADGGLKVLYFDPQPVGFPCRRRRIDRDGV